MSEQQFAPLDLNEFAEICHNAHIAFCLDKFPSSERALEHFYIEHLNRRAAVQAAQPEAVGDVAELLSWFDEAGGFNQGTKAPHKWVLQAEQALRRLASAPTPEPMSAPTEAKPAHADLLKFYGVTDLTALAEAQAHHIEKLQAKLPRNDQPAFTRVREG